MVPDWNAFQVIKMTDHGDETAPMKKGPDGFIIAEFACGMETLDAANLMLEIEVATKKKQRLRKNSCSSRRSCSCRGS